MHLYSLKAQKKFKEKSRDLKKLSLIGQQHFQNTKDQITLYDNDGLAIFHLHILREPIVEKAFFLALKHHEYQKRKCGQRPYIEHPFRVCTIITEIEENPILQAAALGHDLIEDTSCLPQTIAQECSPEILDIIHSVSEKKSLQNWFFKKEQYIQSVQKGGEKAQKVCLADKIANLESLKRQYQEQGERVWKNFKKDKDAKHWFENKVLNMLKTEKNIEEKWIHHYETMLNEIY